jgi:hypothetical protein
MRSSQRLICPIPALLKHPQIITDPPSFTVGARPGEAYKPVSRTHWNLVEDRWWSGGHITLKLFCLYVSDDWQHFFFSFLDIFAKDLEAFAR